MKKIYTIPINEKKIFQLYKLWLNNGYETEKDIDIKKNHLLGSEKEITNIKLFTYELDDQIKSSCITLYDKKLRTLAGLGEVCTEKKSRGNGYAKDLCNDAKEDFFSNKESEGIFLGTVNPVAQKIYENLGWIQIRNSKVMFNSRQNIDFDEFIYDFYNNNQSLTLSKGSSEHRIPIIAYFLSEINEFKVDLNAGIIGNNFSSMCLSAYNKFESIRNNFGDWFVISDNRNKIFAISTIKNIDENNIRIDGNYKKNYKNEFINLIKSNIDSVNNLNLNSLYVNILEKYLEKKEIFNQLGFIEKKEKILIEGKIFSTLILN